MKPTISLLHKTALFVLLYTMVCVQKAHGQQEVAPSSGSKSNYHNQLFFNRFLINPTFSLVREDRSYLNILHRNEYATFEDNNQNYLLAFSNRINERTALGVSVYSQTSGIFQEFGFNANYATAVPLGLKSRLTFGTNVTYYNEGIDRSRVIAEDNDTEILESRKENNFAVQPGVTLSVGKFDFGVYAQNLFKYNQSTNEFQTGLNTENIRASVQYTHNFLGARGFFADAKLVPFVQVGQHQNGDLAYTGALLLNVPKFGWLQTSLNDEHGASMGLGFNLSKRMSLGYLLEKDVTKENVDLGWNHEVSLAYTFKQGNTNINAQVGTSQDKKVDQIIRNYEEQILKLMEEKDALTANEVKAGDPNALAYRNSLILDELMLRQDSLEAARSAAIERKFEAIVRILRSDIKQSLQQQPSNGPDYTVLASNSQQPKNMMARQDISVRLNKNTHKSANKKVAKTATKEIKKLPIKVLDQSNIQGVNSGYYMVANVYKTKKYLDAFMAKLKSRGLNAKKFYNKENGLHYVYLADFNVKEEAKQAYASNLDGKYQDEKWIMEVADNSSVIVNNTFED
ncbi:PorP/SprF family type IX secretion system membrane protein [Spongiimicrobium salis]|uniref:PorP/SprF family type IX secretion system membrane protein n=1 Tax=Spongiimicrobium salis TaxID=1667022 RepID=UPI00374D3472